MAEPQNVAEFQKALMSLTQRYWTQRGRNNQAVMEMIGALEDTKLRLHAEEISRQNSVARTQFHQSMRDDD